MLPIRIFCRLLSAAAVCCLLVSFPALAHKTPAKTAASAAKGKGRATVAEALAFMKKAEEQLQDVGVNASRASWVQQTFITDDTEILSAQAQEQLTALTTQLALDARRFERLRMPPELARKFKLLKLSLTAPAPNNAKERAELTRIAASLDADYGKGKYWKIADRPDGLIPAHLLGNMWSQEWGNIYPLVAPANADKGYDLTQLLKDHKVDELGMVHYGENFFKSLGFEAAPQSFWERSLFIKPHDRDVVCHASAWDIDNQDDVRLKMCIEIRDEDFVTIHHELGHNFYQRAYKSQSALFQDSANDGFHDAVGDTIALSVTPEYLKEVGLLQNVPPESADTGYLLKMALDKIAFLPFGLLIDQWRWKVFSGEITPEQYNQAWWELRTKYQGIAPPVERSEADFDPGAKYHVASNIPYTRYFLARILQFQFHRALCQAAGIQGPLHRCSIYKNKAAGERLNKMLSMGKR